MKNRIVISNFHGNSKTDWEQYAFNFNLTPIHRMGYILFPVKTQMKYTHLKIIILSISILHWQSIIAKDTATLSLSSFENSQNCVLDLEKEIEERWEKVKETKKIFSHYEKKSPQEIVKEFQALNKFRKQLWYINPEESEPIASPDYLKATIPNNIGTIRHAPFDYNSLDKSYNASAIYINGHHFIALREPTAITLNAFFNLLLNQRVSILVRLNQAKEYFQRHKFLYWGKYVVYESNHAFIQPKVIEEDGVTIGLPIPYFYTNEWQDHKGVPVHELYQLVQKVRETYGKIQNPGPIACHCKAGVGRTGTFIAAYVLAHMFDILDPSEISIEAIVLKLSIQRPAMAATKEQYSSLYEFCDYYLAKKKETQ